MRRFLSLLLSFCIIGMSAGCGQEQSAAIALPGTIDTPSSENSAAIQEETDPRILIAYFSWSGNTEQVANEIQRKTGGDIFEISPAEPYPSDFNETAARWHEERDADARPEILGTVDNMKDYDYVFLGYPIWSSALPAVNCTFLEQYDFSGKTIIPFCTHGGSAFGNSVSRIKSLVPDATVADGYEIRGDNASNCEAGVVQWLEELGIVL